MLSSKELDSNQSTEDKKKKNQKDFKSYLILYLILFYLNN